MAQCSFHPSIVSESHSGSRRPSAVSSGGDRPCISRSSSSSGISRAQTPTYSANHRRGSAANSDDLYGHGNHNRGLTQESPESSEYWDGETSSASGAQEEVDVTILPSEGCGGRAAAHRPPRPPRHCGNVEAEEAQQFRVVQRLQE